MGDKELIEHIAREWIRLGGDAEGVAWCWRALQAEVQRQQEADKEAL